MSVVINIKGTPIEFPSTGESPNWAPAVIEFAQVVEDAIDTAVGVYDVPATVVSITSDYITYPTATTIPITELFFSTTAVRSFILTYVIVLDKTGGSDSESGTLTAYYDVNNSPKWTITRDYIGEANTNFNVIDDGQVTITINEPSVNYYSAGKFSFFAKTLEQI